MAQGAGPAPVALLLVAAACATPPEPGMSIPVTVSRPQGAGPFPAVVVMHDCSGLGPRSSGAPGRWAQLLVERGYVVIMPDSFSTRGFPRGVCTDPSKSRLNVAPNRRAQDAFEALGYAQRLPYVDARRVGIMGGSHGGATTLV
ncbi:MAG TPA: dienelactone hydrolase family protein, partial [Reyranellaceae bacterium]|nr:dienelactone hydrolase family protein [Reyranellaceae bacterium]